MIIHLGYLLPDTSSDLPESIGRAALKRFPIWSCTGWGLHSFSGHPENWCALTAPFHPYRKAAVYFLLHFPHVTVTPRYGASCSLVFGLSSAAKPQRSSCRL